MIHAYTFGKGSKQFLILRPKDADAIDIFTSAFFMAQEDFKRTHGRSWTPSEPIAFRLDYTTPYVNHYNKIVAFLNFQHKIRNWLFTLLRIDVRHEDLDDYLVKRF